MTFDLTGGAPSWPSDMNSMWAAGLREALSEADAWYGPRSRGESMLLEVLGELIEVEPRRIIVTSGVRAAVIAFGAFTSRLVVERPTFAQIPELFQAMDVPVRCAAWPDLVDSESWSGGTIWVTSPARNPDGACIEPGLAARLRDAAAARHGFMVINETYGWYAERPALTGCVRVGSLSKLVGGGARLGWIVDAPPVAEAALVRLGPATAWQRAWASFLRRTGRDRLLGEFVRPITDAREAFLAGAGDDVGRAVRPGHGPSVLIPLGEAWSEQRAAALLATRGLRVGLGSDFLSDRPSIRLAFTGLTPSDALEAGQIFRAIVADQDQIIDDSDDLPGRTTTSSRYCR